MTAKPILAKNSIVGHYRFHYPDVDSPGFIIQAGSKLKKLNWVSVDKWDPYLWVTNEKEKVVWIKKVQNN